MAISQKQKSIRSLHEAARQSLRLGNILEISSKSESETGIRLSAFNLLISLVGGLKTSVEALFQGSKVFSYGGPYTDIYFKSARDAKTDPRLKTSGELISFRCADFDWPLDPQTAFYDWLYLSALQQNQVLADKLIEYDGFTDIEFNPEKSLNCQAAAAALYKSLVERQLLGSAMAGPADFLKLCGSYKATRTPIQRGLL